MAILAAINAPTNPPNAIGPKINNELLTKTFISLRDKRVTTIAMVIPPIPKKFPFRDVSGELRPLRARIKKIPDTKYKKAVKLAEIIFIYFYPSYTF